MPNSFSNRRASDRGASPTSAATSSNLGSSASRCAVIASARRTSADRPLGICARLGRSASDQVAWASAWNIVVA